MQNLDALKSNMTLGRICPGHPRTHPPALPANYPPQRPIPPSPPPLPPAAPASQVQALFHSLEAYAQPIADALGLAGYEDELTTGTGSGVAVVMIVCSSVGGLLCCALAICLGCCIHKRTIASTEARLRQEYDHKLYLIRHPGDRSADVELSSAGIEMSDASSKQSVGLEPPAGDAALTSTTADGDKGSAPP